VPRENVRTNSRESKLIADLNRGWVGLRMHHLLDISAKARPEGPPGVVVATVVHSKSETLIRARADMIKEIVRRGLVNCLIISKNLADALRADFPDLNVQTQPRKRTANACA
jgi:hypothetical protein